MSVEPGFQVKNTPDTSSKIIKLRKFSKDIEQLLTVE